MNLSFNIISSYGDISEELFDFIKAHDEDFYPPISKRKTITDYVRSIFDIDGRFLACYDNGKLVGLLGIALAHPTFIHFYHYAAIDSDYRNKGIASALFQKAEEICRAHGAQRVTARTWSLNKTSQLLLESNGFVHVDTVTDDRGKGVHTYYYTKSLADMKFRQPVKLLGMIGGMGTYSTGMFAQTISCVPKTIIEEQQLLPFIIVNDPTVPNRIKYITEHREAELTEKLKEVISLLPQGKLSHILFLCFTIHPYIRSLDIDSNVEILDLVTISEYLVKRSGKKYLLLATNIVYTHSYFHSDNIHFPGDQHDKRIQEVIRDVKAGIAPPHYYRQEVVAMAKANDCDGILIGCTDIHNMFGFDKAYNGIEVIDPLIELALIINGNR